MSVLADLDWNLENPDVWIDPSGSLWQIDLVGSQAFVHEMQPFVDAIQESVEAKLWQSASMNYLGQGLADGVSFRSLKSAPEASEEQRQA